jgi:hypothetical protein
VIDGSRARRHRRQMMDGPPSNSPGQQQQLPPGHPQILNGPGQRPQQQEGQNNVGFGKNTHGAPGQAGRQMYYPYQGQTGYGTVQGLNYPYAGAGLGTYQYGSGQCKTIH